MCPAPSSLQPAFAARIDSVAGVAVPADPTGSADVVLPATQTNPVTITFASTNVPPGNTVLFKSFRPTARPLKCLAWPLRGTTASGIASVQVSLPQGPSTLQATTTYTVVVAMGDALSQFAQNERVEKVQLSATLGGADSQVKLITVSGKEYLVPATVLQLVGLPVTQRHCWLRNNGKVRYVWYVTWLGAGAGACAAQRGGGLALGAGVRGLDRLAGGPCGAGGTNHGVRPRGGQYQPCQCSV